LPWESRETVAAAQSRKAIAAADLGETGTADRRETVAAADRGETGTANRGETVAAADRGETGTADRRETAVVAKACLGVSACVVGGVSSVKFCKVFCG
jgi:hypothetical protein